jgi:hypothetical protein
VYKQEFRASSWRSNHGYTKMHGQPTNKTLGKLFQNLEKHIQVCLDVKGDQFRHRLWAGHVLHSSPVCVYKFSSHYLNNIIFIDKCLGPLATESPCPIPDIICNVNAHRVTWHKFLDSLAQSSPHLPTNNLICECFQMK